MQKIIKKLFSTPSIKLNWLVALEIVALLIMSLGGLFYFTRKALVEEAKMDAELRYYRAASADGCGNEDRGAGKR